LSKVPLPVKNVARIFDYVLRIFCLVVPTF